MNKEFREKAVAAALQNVEEQHFERTGKLMSANDIAREALGFQSVKISENQELPAVDAIAAAIEYIEGLKAIDNAVGGIGYERIKVDIGNGKCKIGFDVKKREEWDDAAIIEVFDEFLRMMKAPSEKINVDEEL